MVQQPSGQLDVHTTIPAPHGVTHPALLFPNRLSRHRGGWAAAAGEWGAPQALLPLLCPAGCLDSSPDHWFDPTRCPAPACLPTDWPLPGNWLGGCVAVCGCECRGRSLRLGDMVAVAPSCTRTCMLGRDGHAEVGVCAVEGRRMHGLCPSRCTCMEPALWFAGGGPERDRSHMRGHKLRHAGRPAERHGLPHRGERAQVRKASQGSWRLVVLLSKVRFRVWLGSWLGGPLNQCLDRLLC